MLLETDKVADVAINLFFRQCSQLLNRPGL